MLFSDTYKTIEKEAGGLFRDRGSRFIAIAVPVSNQEEIKARLEELKKEYHDARHHCYAWMLTPDDESSDGKFIDYLSKPVLWRNHDHELYEELQRLINQKENGRKIN